MSQISAIFGTDDDEEIMQSLYLIVNNTDGLGLIHESVSIYNQSDFTRTWFAWANSYFADAATVIYSRLAADSAFTSSSLQGSLGSVGSPAMLILDNSNDLINPQVTEQEIGSDLEPLQDEEVIQFRAQVLNMGVLSSDGMNSRERELARMVLRLTESSRPSSAQIASQAAIILDLSTQRDYLIQQAEEERARWESEREGWERASEALIAQRNAKDHYSNRHQANPS
ncbi:hypothetical protein HHX47_DHR5000447 [Lentinula edodes]|nr:hypothetical protein HHX47_DHR5000447 [Lentinula edodes]